MFSVEAGAFALDLSYVERVVWAAHLIPMPQEESKIHAGMINVYGEIIPVVNLRGILKLPVRDMELSDQFIICRYEKEPLALWVDRVYEVKIYDSACLVPSEHKISTCEFVSHMLKDKGSVAFVWDVKALFIPQPL